MCMYLHAASTRHPVSTRGTGAALACNVSPYAARKHGSSTDAAITLKGRPGANDLHDGVARLEGGGGASCGARSGDLSSLRACEGA